MLAFDLEMNQPSNNIIQIGAVVGDLVTGAILEELNIYVNLSEEEKVTPYITKLTGITQDHLDTRGIGLALAYSQLKHLHTRHSPFINPLTWGGGDTTCLRSQLAVVDSAAAVNWCFGRRWIDVKTVFQTVRLAQNKEFRGGLSKSLLKLGIKFNGTAHNAVDDARNTFLIYKELLTIINKEEK